MGGAGKGHENGRRFISLFKIGGISLILEILIRGMEVMISMVWLFL